MNGYREATAGFVQGAKGVVGAANMLRTAVAGGDTSDIEFASEILASAAESYAGNTSRYERFRF
jgi:hypothetical protein